MKSESTNQNWAECKLTRKTLRSGNFSHWKWRQIFPEKNVQFQKPHQIAKSKKFWKNLNLQASNLAPKAGNSLVVRWVLSGGIKILLFWEKDLVLDQVNSKVTIRRVQNTIFIDFICVSCVENDCYRVVSAGQLKFDCRAYCGPSCRMQDRTGNWKYIWSFLGLIFLAHLCHICQLIRWTVH